MGVLLEKENNFGYKGIPDWKEGPGGSSLCALHFWSDCCLGFWGYALHLQSLRHGQGKKLNTGFQNRTEQGENGVCEATEDVFDKPKLGMKRKKVAIWNT